MDEKYECNIEYNRWWVVQSNPKIQCFSKLQIDSGLFRATLKYSLSAVPLKGGGCKGELEGPYEMVFVITCT